MTKAVVTQISHDPTGITFTVESDADGFVVVKEGGRFVHKLTPLQAARNGERLREQALTAVGCRNWNADLGAALLDEAEKIVRVTGSILGRRDHA